MGEGAEWVPRQPLAMTKRPHFSPFFPPPPSRTSARLSQTSPPPGQTSPRLQRNDPSIFKNESSFEAVECSISPAEPSSEKNEPSIFPNEPSSGTKNPSIVKKNPSSEAVEEAFYPRPAGIYREKPFPLDLQPPFRSPRPACSFPPIVLQY